MPHLSESARRQLEAAERAAESFGNQHPDDLKGTGVCPGQHPDDYVDAIAPNVAARARPQPGPGRMNKTEVAYDQHLGLRLAAGELVWYRFEAIKLRLAPKTFYTPDFAMITAAGELAFHEVKGHWEDDARVKIKVAAEMYPFFRFVAVQKVAKRDGGGWRMEGF